MVKRAKRPRLQRLRFRKNDPVHNLLAAVQHWTLARGGMTIVLGGIEVQRWPGDPDGKFKVAIGCLGRPPVPKSEGAKS